VRTIVKFLGSVDTLSQETVLDPSVVKFLLALGAVTSRAETEAMRAARMARALNIVGLKERRGRSVEARA